VQGLGFRISPPERPHRILVVLYVWAAAVVQGRARRIQSLGCRVEDSGTRVKGSGFRVQRSRCKEYNSWSRVQG